MVTSIGLGAGSSITFNLDSSETFGNLASFANGTEYCVTYRCDGTSGSSGSSGSSGTSGSSGSSGTSGSSGSSGTSGINLCISQKANTTGTGVFNGQFTVSTTSGTGGVTSDPTVAPYFIYLDDNGYLGDTLVTDYVINYIDGIDPAAGLITFTDAEGNDNYVSYYFSDFFVPSNRAYIRFSCNGYSSNNPNEISGGFTDFVDDTRYCIRIQTFQF
jgi:hypothetical protein